jgi:hypothetical protein
MSDESCSCGCNTTPAKESTDDCTCGCGSRSEKEPKEAEVS